MLHGLIIQKLVDHTSVWYLRNCVNYQ